MLAILATHPIQYQVPLWQALAQKGEVPFEVWYLTDHASRHSHDREFGKSFAWDIDILTGYPHQFLKVALGASPNSFWRCRIREPLAKRLRSTGAKALWVQGWQVAAYWQAVWAAKRVGVEVWLRGESNDLAPAAWWKRPTKRFLLGLLFKRVDRFLHIGTANRRLYQKFGVPESKLYPAPYAVDNERFARQANQIRNQRPEIRKAWNIPENAFCILFCGKFIPKKRPMDLTTAARLLIARNSELLTSNSNLLPSCPIHLLFVGSGVLGRQLRAACNVVFDAESPNSCVPSAISSLPPASFAGFLNQTEISRAYVAADCLVLPSDSGETWGLVVNEAMASGLVCILSDQCGSSLDLGNLGGNQVFSCGDTRALAARLSALASPRNIDAPACATRQPPSLQQTVQTAVSLYLNGIAAQNQSTRS